MVFIRDGAGGYLMSMSPLVPLFAALTLSLLPLLLRLFERKVDAIEVYVIPVLLRVFLWGGAVLIALAPAIFTFTGANLSPVDWIVAEVLGFFVFLSSFYANLYMVRLTATNLQFSGFRNISIPYDAIDTVSIASSGRGPSHLVVTYFGSRRLVISGYIGHFDELVVNLKENMSGLTGGKRA